MILLDIGLLLNLEDICHAEVSTYWQESWEREQKVVNHVIIWMNLSITASIAHWWTELASKTQMINFIQNWIQTRKSQLFLSQEAQHFSEWLVMEWILSPKASMSQLMLRWVTGSAWAPWGPTLTDAKATSTECPQLKGLWDGPLLLAKTAKSKNKSEYWLETLIIKISSSLILLFVYGGFLIKIVFFFLLTFKSFFAKIFLNEQRNIFKIIHVYCMNKTKNQFLL